MSQDPLVIDDKTEMILPGMEIPGFRTKLALQNGVNKNLLITTWGGIGDQVCAEPTIRYALNNFTNCEISLLTASPELFKHLQNRPIGKSLKYIYNALKPAPDLKKFMVFHTNQPHTSVVYQFMSHMITNCLDFPSLCAFRMQLPLRERMMQLHSVQPNIEPAILKNAVIVHPGKHWDSKTFPPAFWEAVIAGIGRHGHLPIIIGSDMEDKKRGTVDIHLPHSALDLRNKLSLVETSWLLQNARVVVTNDSSPLHIAAAGRGSIGFLATSKHPDFITHWRPNDFGQPTWGWEMQNFSKGCALDGVNVCPNSDVLIKVENVPADKVLSWLPDPEDLIDWAHITLTTRKRFRI